MILSLFILLGSGLLLGCEDVEIASPKIIVEENPSKTMIEDALVISSNENSVDEEPGVENQPLVEPSLSSPNPLNCTIKQFMRIAVQSDRFHCEVKDLELNIYSPSIKDHIGKLNPVLGLYIIKNHAAPTITVKGQVAVIDNHKWEFIPQENDPRIGPSRVQVIID